MYGVTLSKHGVCGILNWGTSLQLQCCGEDALSEKCMDYEVEGVRLRGRPKIW